MLTDDNIHQCLELMRGALTLLEKLVDSGLTRLNSDHALGHQQRAIEALFDAAKEAGYIS